MRISLPSSARTKLTEAGDALRGDDSDIEAAHEASEAGDAANALLSPYEASEVDEAEAEDALFQGDSNIEAAHERIPGVRCALVKNGGHAVTIDQPEATNRALLEFLLEILLEE